MKDPTMSSCVHSGLCMVKSTDKNLVDGRRGNTFKVLENLLSMECEWKSILRTFVEAKGSRDVPSRGE